MIIPYDGVHKLYLDLETLTLVAMDNESFDVRQRRFQGSGSRVVSNEAHLPNLLQKFRDIVVSKKVLQKMLVHIRLGEVLDCVLKDTYKLHLWHEQYQFGED